MNKKIDKKILLNGLLVELKVPANISYLPILQNISTTIAKWLGFDEDHFNNLELIVEESFVSIVENSFDPEEFGEIRFFVRFKPGKLILSFEDKGLPVDVSMLEKQEHSALGILIIKHLADEFKFVNLGKDGKRLEIVINIPEGDINGILEKEAAQKAEPAPLDEELHFRMIEPADVLDLTRLTYRAYGYTYMGIAYFPEKLKELLDYGYMKAVVVHNSKNEMIANLGLFFDKPGSKVADSGMAIVDPRYRGHNLFKRMKAKAVEHGRETGMYGLYSESVTIHPYTQKGNITLGAKEIGSLIAFTGEHISFKKINDEGLSQRQAVMLYYLKINEEPQREVFIPEPYKEMITSIYDDLGLSRKLNYFNRYKNISELSGITISETVFKPDLNSAIISIEKYGEDIVPLVQNSVKELCMKKVDTIYLELPLSDPNTMFLVPKFRETGFFFGGVIPEFRNGDILKLQYLNNIYIDPEKICVASDNGRKILSFILSDREKTG